MSTLKLNVGRGNNTLVTNRGIPSFTRTPWVRPADWLPLPEVLITDQKFVGLFAVYNTPDNWLALSAAGNYTVNWGDGTIENIASGVTAEHNYSYSNSALNGTECSRGYKQVIVTVTPQAGQNLTNINLQKLHTGLNGGSDIPWLDINLSGPNLTSLTIGATYAQKLRSLERCNILTIGSVTNLSSLFSDCFSLQSVSLFNTANVTNMSAMFRTCGMIQSIPFYNTANVTNMNETFYRCASLQSVYLYDTSKVTNMSGMFQNCVSLQSVPLYNTANVTNMGTMFTGSTTLQSVPPFNTSKVTDMNNMFAGCSLLQSVPLFNTSLVTNMNNMFYNCTSLQSVPLFNTANVTNMSNMFNGCASLQSVPLFNTALVTNMSNMFLTYSWSSLQTVPQFNTANVTNMSNMFLNCYVLKSVPAMNVSSVSSSTNFGSMFSSCFSLAKIEAKEFKYTFSVASCNLSANSLNEIYTNLPTVSGQTITVTGNYGTANDDPTIATAKGWTVTG